MATSIHDKISKLLALSSSPNDNEAATALRLAQKLMLEHGIEQDALNPTKKPEVGQTDRSPYKQEFQLRAAEAAAYLYSCRVVFWKSPIKENELAFVGRRDNREIAQATWAFFLLQIEAWYKNELPKGMTQRERADYRKDYKLAMAKTLVRRCLEWQPASTGTALVLHKSVLEEEVNDFIAGIKVAKPKQQKIKHFDAYYKGIAAGNAADIHKGVNN